MIWADKLTNEFLEQHSDEVKKGKHFIIRDEKTISGHPHVGSLRSFTLHATLSDVFTDRNIPHTYLYEINDTDSFEKVPRYVDDSWAEHIGKPLRNVPSPDGKAKSFAEFFAQTYTDLLEDAKYNVEFYFNSDRYLAGDYDKYIKLAIEHRHDIRKIYKEVSGGEKKDTWYPVQVLCDKCGKIATTRITDWDGEEVTYSCTQKTRYTEGCGHEGKKSPFGGEATMPWKVEWAAKFCINNVDLEAAGKDHYAAGGSRHISNRICKEIFNHPQPFDIRHEFILVGGAKMSSSSGVGLSAHDMYHSLPRYMFRFFMLYKDVMKTLNFTPDGDTIPVLYDTYDRMLQEYLKPDEEANMDHKRIIQLTHFYEPEKNLNRFTPRFSQLAFLAQVPHVDIEAKVAEMKGAPLTDEDREEIKTRVENIRHWLETFSPEKYQFKIQEDSVPPSTKDLNDTQKDVLKRIAAFFKENPEASGEDIHGFLHSLKEATGCPPRELFQAIYHAIFGKGNGPKAGFLLSTLDKEWIVKRFEEV